MAPLTSNRAREFVLRQLKAIRQAFPKDDDDAEAETMLALLDEISEFISREFSQQRIEEEMEHWTKLLEECKLILNDLEKFAQLERALTNMDLAAKMDLAGEQLAVMLAEHGEEWKQFLRPFSNLAVEFKQRASESANAQRALELFRKHTLSSLFAWLVKELFARFERERGVSTRSEQQAWLALIEFKSAIAAFSLYNSESNTRESSALALAMIATSLDVNQVERAIRAQFYDGDGAQLPSGKRLADFFQLWSAKLQARREFLQLLFKNFAVAEIQTWEDVKNMVVRAVNQLVSQWELPKLEGRREGVRYSCTRMKLSSFHIAGEDVELRALAPTVAALEAGRPVLTLHIKRIAAKVTGLHYMACQEYFPYLASEGEAECDIAGVSVLCELQLICGDNGGEAASAPALQLRLAKCQVSIASVQLEILQSKDMWLMNLIKDIMARTLQTYLAVFLQDEIQLVVTFWLERLNQVFAQRVNPLLQSFVNMDISGVPTLERAMAMEGNPFEKRADLYSVRFDRLESGVEAPDMLGLVLIPAKRGNGVVVDPSFTPDRDGKIKAGDQLVGVNGMDISSLPVERVRARLRRCRRPVVLTFAPSAASAAARAEEEDARVCVKTFTFTEEKLCLAIKPRRAEEQDVGAVVSGFRLNAKGGIGPAEAAGVPLNWVLVAINGTSMLKHTFRETMNLFATLSARPIELTFCRNPDVHVEINEPGLGVNLVTLPGENTIAVSEFVLLRSAMEPLLVGLESGDQVMRVGDVDTSRMAFEQVVVLLKAVTTASPGSSTVPIEFGEKRICGHFPVGRPLGMVFYKSDSLCKFKAFQDFEGPLQRLGGGGLVRPGHALISVNGIKITSEEQAKHLLENPPSLPLKLAFRDLESYAAGGWGRD